MSDPGANPFAKYAPAAPQASDNPFAKYAGPNTSISNMSDDQAREKLGIPQYQGRLSDTILKGATFGLNDEIGAGMEAPLQYGLDTVTGKKPDDASLGDYYRANLSNIREGEAKYEGEHPVASTAGQFVGGAMDFNPASVTKAIAGGVKEAIGKGAVTGAAIGGASGFGNAEGGWKDRALGALQGGTVGGVVGAASPVIIPWLAKAGIGVKDMVSNAIAPWSKDLDGFISETAGKVLNHAAGAGGAEFEQAPIAGMKPTTGQSSNNPGLLWLERSVEQSSPESSAAAAESRTANNQALHQAIGQIGDLNNPADQAMREALVRGQPEGTPEGRVLDLAGQNLGDSDFYETGKALNATRSAASRPLWDAAMDRPPVITDRLKQFMADPDIQQGMSTGVKLARRQALADGEPFDPHAYAITGFNEAGDPQIGPVPTWRTWQAAKEGLDAKINSMKDNFGRLPKTKDVQSYLDLKNALLNELDAVNPDYAAARSAWSGPSDSMDALNAGRDIFRGDSEITAQRIAKLKPGDSDFYRVGVLRAIDDTVNNSQNGAGALKSMLAKPNVQEKLSAAFKSPEEFEDFQKNAADILNPQGDIAKATAKNSAGQYTMPDSAVASQFIRPGKGGPEALQAYLHAVGDDEGGLQAARDAFAQKLMDKVQTTVPDQVGDRVVSASKMTNFLDQYKHVVNSGLFSDEQKGMIQNIATAADMAQRTARAGAKGGSDTFAKLQGNTFLDVLIGPGASKIAPVAGAVIGAHFGGAGGAAAGLVGANYGMSKLEQTLYGASRDKVVNLINQAMSDPDLAKALMTKASSKASLQMPAPARRMIYSILGADTWNTLGGQATNAASDYLKNRNTTQQTAP